MVSPALFSLLQNGCTTANGYYFFIKEMVGWQQPQLTDFTGGTSFV
jgi:hypothetical protein